MRESEREREKQRSYIHFRTFKKKIIFFLFLTFVN
jgi:hypothetical protein